MRLVPDLKNRLELGLWTLNREETADLLQFFKMYGLKVYR